MSDLSRELQKGKGIFRADTKQWCQIVEFRSGLCCSLGGMVCAKYGEKRKKRGGPTGCGGERESIVGSLRGQGR